MCKVFPNRNHPSTNALNFHWLLPPCPAQMIVMDEQGKRGCGQQVRPYEPPALGDRMGRGPRNPEGQVYLESCRNITVMAEVSLLPKRQLCPTPCPWSRTWSSPIQPWLELHLLVSKNQASSFLIPDYICLGLHVADPPPALLLLNYSLPALSIPRSLQGNPAACCRSCSHGRHNAEQ